MGFKDSKTGPKFDRNAYGIKDPIERDLSVEGPKKKNSDMLKKGYEVLGKDSTGNPVQESNADKFNKKDRRADGWNQRRLSKIKSK